MDIYEELKQFAEKFEAKIIGPKAPPLTDEEIADMEAYLADPNRFIDYTGILR